MYLWYIVWVHYRKEQTFIMEIGKLIKKSICVACICFTLITAAFMLIMMLIYPNDENVLVDAFSVVLFFVFSVLFAGANALLSIEKINGAVRYFIHYIICVFAFYTCFLLPYTTSTSASVILVAVFSVLYVIIMVIIGAFKSKLKKNREATLTYTNQFKQKK